MKRKRGKIETHKTNTGHKMTLTNEQKELLENNQERLKKAERVLDKEGVTKEGMRELLIVMERINRMVQQQGKNESA